MDKNADKAEASTSVAILDFEHATGLTHLKSGIQFDRELLETYISAAAPNSIRALKQDTEAFDLWCRRQGLHSFPATPKQVADWLQYRADEGASPASLVRYKASIAKTHRLIPNGR